MLRLFALALADGSGLPFSLYPPLAALESQLCKGSWQAVGLTEGLYPRPVIAFTPNFDSKAKSVLCGGAASAPSEEGAVGLHKGFKQYD